MEGIIDQANRYAAENAVEYLTSINTYDLKELGEERFKTLIEVITKNYHEKIAELDELDIAPPFQL